MNTNRISKIIDEQDAYACGVQDASWGIPSQLGPWMTELQMEAYEDGFLYVVSKVGLQ